MARKLRILKPKHELPGCFWLDYILLPCGEFYQPTAGFADAKKGDTLRFFNGPEFPIVKVCKIRQDEICDLLCHMRYRISWAAAFKRWQSYAMLEGNGKDVLSKEYCYLVFYERDFQNQSQVR